MFDLKKYLNERTELVNNVLQTLLSAQEQRPERLTEAMTYSLFTGGKRVRPVLCIAAAEAAGGNIDTAMPPAIAVEMLHTYTLVHDDLPCMDDDDYRRGQLTCHKKYDEWTAVLTGDALQTEAFAVLTDPSLPETYPSRRLVFELAKAAGKSGVIGGQVEDILFAGKPLTEDRLAYIHQHKTADLFIAAIRMGAISAGADNFKLESLTTYASSLGIAFQLADDLLDAPEEGETPSDLSALSVFSAGEIREKAYNLIAEAKDAIKWVEPKFAAPLTAIADFVIERNY